MKKIKVKALVFFILIKKLKKFSKKGRSTITKRAVEKIEA